MVGTALSPKLSIVDNDNLVLQCMCEYLERRYGPHSMVWTAIDGRNALDLCFDGSRERPDIVLIDMSLEGISGATVGREIRRRSFEIATIGITSFSLARYTGLAAQNGMQALCSKSDLEGLCDIIDSLTSGTDSWHSPEFQSAWDAHIRVRDEPVSVAALLSRREAEILNLVALGLSNSEIARNLCISESTVKTHIENACGKIGAVNRTRAAVLWTQAVSE
ncbi:response regulator transcription factor [uncultured Bifidobacterium sp.]|uniref:response regulator transcription factor n=1 Tax=uncultured Bifidobacterium sp. TaxID=165187 RepID=UPI0025947D98|nr:response regulator transcription factor [uncultured Bifidobacterium sp.]